MKSLLNLGFRVQGLGFRVQGLGFRVQGLGFRASSPRSLVFLSCERAPHPTIKWNGCGGRSPVIGPNTKDVILTSHPSQPFHFFPPSGSFASIHPNSCLLEFTLPPLNSIGPSLSKQPSKSSFQQTSFRFAPKAYPKRPVAQKFILNVNFTKLSFKSLP